MWWSMLILWWANTNKSMYGKYQVNIKGLL